MRNQAAGQRAPLDQMTPLDSGRAGPTQRRPLTCLRHFNWGSVWTDGRTDGSPPSYSEVTLN